MMRKMEKISLLQAENISKRFGDLLLFENISFGISEGEKVALIAKNGTGKSTLLNILAGEDKADSGKITSKQNLRLAFLPQNIVLDPSKKVIDAVLSLDSSIMKAVKDYQNALESGNENDLQTSIDKMDSENAWDAELRLRQILTNLKINETDKKLSLMSGGEQKRVALASVLLQDPELLILDEPTNHLDLGMIEWLEDFLINSGITLLMVTHDRYFLDRVCNKILELDNQEIHTYKGNFSYYLQKRSERKYVEAANIDKANNLLKKEEEWIKKMPKARGTKSKFRIDNYYEIKKKAQKTAEQELKINVPSTRLGNKVFELHNISKKFEDKILFKGFNYKFARKEKIGIIGDNGTGKTSFLNLLTGDLKPDSGIIEKGKTVNIAHYKQEGMNFNEEQRIIDAIEEIAEVVDLGNDKKFTASQFLQHFMFPVKKQQQKIHKLSGGEKRRLYLCTILIRKPNFLILDEPTNDLDIVSLQILEEYLINFDGCVLIVSHDRYFMDKIVDHLFVFEGNGEIKDFPGNYSVYRSEKEHYKYLDKVRKKNKNKEKSAKEGQPKIKNSYKNRLSYKEKVEFDKISDELDKLNKEKSELENALSSGSLSGKELEEKSSRHQALKDEIDIKEMKWLELSEKSNNK